MSDLLREFCAENYTNVPAAIEAGARRIELCDNLAVGGTSPSMGVIEATVEYAHARGARVMAMVRPRGGDFVYSAREVEMMETDARIALALGVDGIVFGCLAADETGALALDVPTAERLMAIAREAASERGEAVDVTFHMAFDALPEERQLDAIDAIAELGCTRILTHGGPAGTPIEGNLDRLATYIERAAGRLIILPGAGITWENGGAVAARLGVGECHGTKIVKVA
ncbi:copper homeostasis protein CutC [Collinsella intestinalis]|uniref:copper homeostasis protein CutC n=1 Tax=Collinsella intestinalis TaxID=147207 RepID=UPI001956DCE7|nr:copper homeostasis protein CutC [Collinsella intestinalis]MBM6942090.1 copper homeostasis protein CutC [Collinsella intestinalis]